jgi:hypothetical protein
MGLSQADNAVLNPPLPVLIEMPLLPVHLLNHQQSPIPKPRSDGQGCPSVHQPSDVGQIAPQIAQLLTNRVTNLPSGGTALFGHLEIVAPGMLPVGAGFAHPRLLGRVIELVEDAFTARPSGVEQMQVSGVVNIGGRHTGINDQLPVVRGRRWVILIV